MAKDRSAILPNGQEFSFWEKETIYSREIHVSAEHGNDQTGNGSPEAPFATINAAAALAEPCTKVVIHAGTYHECVVPRKGGEAPDRMIAYEAAGDGEVDIRASEVVTGFSRSEQYRIENDSDGTVPVIWEYSFSKTFFEGYNPFGLMNIIHERNCFHPKRISSVDPFLLRRGMIFVDGKPLKQVQVYRLMQNIPGSYWVEEGGMKVHFRLPDNDSPDDHLIEMTCREQCFAPEVPFLSYIKVKGLTFTHAANGAPVPQHGALSCARGHHWVIEDCTVNWASAVGFDVGNEGWSFKRIPGQIIGHSVIRRCKILDCGVCGIAGIGASNMLIEDTLIAGTGWQNEEESWESAAIKFHHCHNSLFRRNIIRDCEGCTGVWLDCDNENDRFTQNLFLRCRSVSGMIFMECTRNPETIIDNNIFWDSYFWHEPQPSFISNGVEENAAQWKSNTDEGGMPGNAVQGDGTDHLHVTHNIFGCIDGDAFMQDVSAGRIGKRGGTSRKSIIRNNVFYDCRRSAIRVANNDNTIDGNYYSRMPGGFLRIRYPVPSQFLDLEAWREFEGFDMNGGYASFEAKLDADDYTMVISDTKPGSLWADEECEGYSAIPKVAHDGIVDIDYFGTICQGDRQPGPFVSVNIGEKFSIDPRKL